MKPRRNARDERAALLQSRNLMILAALGAGLTCREVGRRFGLTGARVCQIRAELRRAADGRRAG